MRPEPLNEHFSDGDPVTAEDMTAALTAGEFVYHDNATQTFEAAGTTTYVGNVPRSGGL